MEIWANLSAGSSSLSSVCFREIEFSESEKEKGRNRGTRGSWNPPLVTALFLSLLLLSALFFLPPLLNKKFHFCRLLCSYNDVVVKEKK